MKTDFVHFKQYAGFLHQIYPDVLTKTIVEKARKAHFSLFTLLLKYTKEEAHVIFRNILEEQILIPLFEGDPFQGVQKTIEAWKDNRYYFSKSELDIEDITLIHNTRQETFLDLIPYYNCSSEELLYLVKDINIYFNTCLNLNLKAYKDLHFTTGNPVYGASKQMSSQLNNQIQENFYFPDKSTTSVVETLFSHENEQEFECNFVNIIEEVKDYAIFLLNPDGTIASWNKGAKALKGYSREEILGKHFSVFYTQDKRDVKFPEYELEQAAKVGKFEDEGWRVRKDGSTFWANVVITAIYTSMGELAGYTKIIRDLTERRCAEETLRRSEEKYKLLLDSVEDYAIFVLDPLGKIVSWNQGAKRLKGYSEEEILGKHFSVFYEQDKVNKNFPQYELERALHEGRFEDEGLRVRKDGSTFYANVVITPLFDSNNNHIGFVKITRDLSERKKSEEKLKKLNTMLEQKVETRTKELRERKIELEKTVNELKRINVDLDNFIYTASHDLKAPISNLEGLMAVFYEELAAQIKGNEGLQSLKSMIELSIQKFQLTIKELTEIAKIQKESLESPEEIDIKELVEDVKLIINDSIKKSGAEIALSLPCPKIKFVRRNLKSIFYNLISNAIKYRSPDRKPLIEVECKLENETYIITCSDNGIGVSPGNIKKMFTMFKRFHTHVEGSGVGLYIVKRIIDNAGGSIEVKSVEGQGTSFKIVLPETKH